MLSQSLVGIGRFLKWFFLRRPTADGISSLKSSKIAVLVDALVGLRVRFFEVCFLAGFEVGGFFVDELRLLTAKGAGASFWCREDTATRRVDFLPVIDFFDGASFLVFRIPRDRASISDSDELLSCRIEFRLRRFFFVDEVDERRVALLFFDEDRFPCFRVALPPFGDATLFADPVPTVSLLFDGLSGLDCCRITNLGRGFSLLADLFGVLSSVDVEKSLFMGFFRGRNRCLSFGSGRRRRYFSLEIMSSSSSSEGVLWLNGEGCFAVYHRGFFVRIRGASSGSESDESKTEARSAVILVSSSFMASSCSRILLVMT